MVTPWVVVSGYLVTHEARCFKDPLLGTFVPCSVLGKELCAHAMIRMIRARQPKCKIDLYDLLALLALYLDSAACTGSLIKKAFPTEKARSIIAEGEGTQFDPFLTKLFLECLKEK